MSILKVEVAKGVHWVEIPDADLRILCGCPADSIKHLMKRGLIQTVEKGGVPYETGPNAVLLSDMSLQNGAFANLAEFPVLQMLYRQGMILPGHPNNTGIKPMLIGSEDQIRAQLEYIFRGNYGLISSDEMLAAGVDPETAAEWMRIKLRFAFGFIRPSRELLDTRVVAGHPVEVKGGVTVQRTALNRFQIAYGDSRVTVDLGIGLKEDFETPYQLGYHNLRREYFAVVHTGEGDGWDVSRPSMGSILMFQGRIYLLDAGPNIDESLRSLGIGIQEVEGIFHTHAHDDHFAGLTALVRADHRIKYFATPAVRASVTKKLAGLMSMGEESFDDFFEVNDLRLDEWNNVSGLEVRPIFSPHPVETTVFLFRAMGDNGYKSYAHMADIVSMPVLDGMVTEDSDEPGCTQDLRDRVLAQYLSRVDIKKLDVGGGLIHGSAQDFHGDRSGKLILAHRATRLTDGEKEIGSGAPFGTMDILIPTMQDYSYRMANSFLRTYFPDTPAHQMDQLLNHEIKLYNPETFLGREGHDCTHVMLMLTGQVEVFQGELGLIGRAAAGAIIGELAAIGAIPYRKTYRTRSFVKALHIPAETFRRFIEENGLGEEIAHMTYTQEFLERSAPFGENMSHYALRRISAAIRTTTLKAGDRVDWGGGDWLCLVQEGVLDIRVAGQTPEQVLASEVCGETSVLFGVPPVYEAVARDESLVAMIPAKMVSSIPVARWNLLEVYQKRMRTLLLAASGGDEVFPWWREFELDVPEMDDQHKQLFVLANRVAGKLSNDKGGTPPVAEIWELVKYTRLHFGTEEKLLTDRGYKKIDHHFAIHVKLLEDVEDLANRIESGEKVSLEEFRSFFLSWIVFHILVEDRRYARALFGNADFVI